MKNKLFIFLVAISFFTSCKTDFKVGADYKEVMVVIGLLDQSDTNHYIKITRGFFSQTLDNFLAAKNEDSVYYKNLNVKVEQVLNGNVVGTHTLTKVNLLSEGIVKDSGIFISNPSYAYKFSAMLNPNSIYRLTIVNPETGNTVTGETPIINCDPLVFRFLKPFTKFEPLDFSDPFGNYSLQFKNPPRSQMYDVMLGIHYTETNTAAVPMTTSRKYFEMTIVKNAIPLTPDVLTSISNENFYSALSSNMKAAETNIVRRIDTPDLYIIAASEEFKKYLDVNSAQGGITFDQIKPNYTNLKGENVLGLFSNRGTASLIGVPFSEATFIEIITGNFTKNLNIVGKTLD